MELFDFMQCDMVGPSYKENERLISKKEKEKKKEKADIVSLWHQTQGQFGFESELAARCEEIFFWSTNFKPPPPLPYSPSSHG